MPEFGVLRNVDLRSIWPKEAFDFTPWLAQNLDKLGEALGMDLELQGHEAPVGPFSLDLLARDLGQDRTVIIENQLEVTNHDHLGKLLTYAAGYDAGAVVWIASEIREQHRQALDWLNQRTDQHTEFFGVVIEALQIDDSRPAYNFKIVAAPNEWRKSALGANQATPSERAESYREFFQALIDRLREQHQFTKARKGQAQSWYGFASGISGIALGLSFAMGGRVRADVYIDRTDASFNKAIFDALAIDRFAIEAEFGEPLEWERLDDKQASRVAVYRVGSIDDSPLILDDIATWAVQRLLRLKSVFGPRIESIIAAMGSS